MGGTGGEVYLGSLVYGLCSFAAGGFGAQKAKVKEEEGLGGRERGREGWRDDWKWPMHPWACTSTNRSS